MNLNKKFEDLLICPLTQAPLTWISAGEVNRLNQRISLGEIKNRQGESLQIELTAALQAGEQDLFYPIEDGIFCLLVDCALFGKFDNNTVNSHARITKNQVKHFYDDFGWQSDSGIYQDAKDSEDLRAVSADYILQCHLRLKQHLPKQGQYLLDVASGPIQYPAYLTYSEHFTTRICADISIRALKEAQKKLGEKGLYLLCDVTNLPLKTNRIDAVVSLHTLYHVPQDEQTRAYAELYRVLKPAGISVVVYSWGRGSFLMNLCLLPWKAMTYLQRKLFNPSAEKSSLYFFAHSYRWFCQELKDKYHTQLFSWRSVNVPFLKIYIHEAFCGRQLLKCIFWLENRFSKQMGRLGAYPMFVSVKK